MKKYLGLLLMGAAFLLSSFNSPAGLDDVINALRTGNASLLAKNFDVTVEVTMPGKSASYSQNQAQTVFSDFFSTNRVQTFTKMHEGKNGGSQYCIGTLITVNGNYRTTIYMSPRGGNLVVKEIRFEK